MHLFYRTKGNAALPPLLLLHGLWGASDNWLPVAERLAGHFHVILPDLRNHGQSPHAAEHTYAAMSGDILELLCHLDLPARPFLAGHSMGGKALMHLLLQHPGIAAKAAVIDISPKPYPCPPTLTLAASPLEAPAISTPGVIPDTPVSTPDTLHARLADLLLHFPFYPGERRPDLHRRIRQAAQDETITQILLKNLRREGDTFTWRLNAPVLCRHLPHLLGWHTPTLPENLRNTPATALPSPTPHPPLPPTGSPSGQHPGLPPKLHPTLHPCHTPILFLRGEHSPYIVPEDLPLIRTLFPAATFDTIPAAGHWIHAEQPSGLAERLQTFFLPHVKMPHHSNGQV